MNDLLPESSSIRRSATDSVFKIIEIQASNTFGGRRSDDFVDFFDRMQKHPPDLFGVLLRQ